MSILPRTLGLPDFPWDLLAPAKALASAHPQGICDLSVGTPVDATPQFIQDALAHASDSPGYPTVLGTIEVREAILSWARTRHMVDVGPHGAIPTIGSKEAVAWLPTELGVRPGDTVLVPDIAYPTYDIGARLAGATPIPVDSRRPETWPDAALVWLNSPGNPNGHVLSRQELRAAISWARQRGAVIISDECYAALAWVAPYIDEGVPSVLDEDVCEGDPSGLLVLYSLSKQSNLAGYRAGLMVGDPELVGAVVEVRKHAGLMVPAPVQHAMASALVNDDHVRAQRETYGRRRDTLRAVLAQAGLEEDPETAAGLYLWVRDSQAPQSQDSWALVERLARLGILVAPGDFYGNAGRGRVRIALTASDDRIAHAAQRLREASKES